MSLATRVHICHGLAKYSEGHLLCTTNPSMAHLFGLWFTNFLPAYVESLSVSWVKIIRDAGALVRNEALLFSSQVIPTWVVTTDLFLRGIAKVQTVLLNDILIRAFQSPSASSMIVPLHLTVLLAKNKKKWEKQPPADILNIKQTKFCWQKLHCCFLKR